MLKEHLTLVHSRPSVTQPNDSNDVEMTGTLCQPQTIKVEPGTVAESDASEEPRDDDDNSIAATAITPDIEKSQTPSKINPKPAAVIPGRLKCPHCALAIFRNKNQLTSHINIRHRRNMNSGKWECPDCGLRYQGKFGMQKHRQKVHGVPMIRLEGPFFCCERKFTLSVAFKNHRIRAHNMRGSPEPGEGTPEHSAMNVSLDGRYKCSHCEAAFKDSRALRSHYDYKHRPAPKSKKPEDESLVDKSATEGAADIAELSPTSSELTPELVAKQRELETERSLRVLVSRVDTLRSAHKVSPTDTTKPISKVEAHTESQGIINQNTAEQKVTSQLQHLIKNDTNRVDSPRSDITNNSRSSAELWTSKGSVMKCLYCAWTSETIKGLNIHMQKKHSEVVRAKTPRRPTPKPSPAPSASSVPASMKSEKSSTPKPVKVFKCPHCVMSFNTEKIYKWHLTTRHTETGELIKHQFKCSRCPLSYKSRGNMRRHYRKTHGPAAKKKAAADAAETTTIQAELAGVELKRVPTTTIQLKTTPTTTPTTTPKVPTLSIFRCCNRTFSSRNAYHIHRGMLHKYENYALPPAQQVAQPATVVHTVPQQPANNYSQPSSSSHPLECKICNEQFLSIISWVNHNQVCHAEEGEVIEYQYDYPNVKQEMQQQPAASIFEIHQDVIVPPAELALLPPQPLSNAMELGLQPPTTTASAVIKTESSSSKKFTLKKSFKRENTKKFASSSTATKSALNPLMPGCNYRSPICKGCGQSFKSYSVCYRHYVSVHMMKRKITCSYCAGQFNTENALKVHMEKAHTAAPDDDEEGIIYL